MKQGHGSSSEFDAVIDRKGRLAVPPPVARVFAGKKVRVRLARKELSAALVDRDVTEEEIDRIAAVQYESREQVVTFLLSEGSLRGNTAFRRRAERSRSAAEGKRP
ncbi:MAG: hypothetical protein C4326_02020 [Ignavibacteria bacterium]